MYTLKTLTIASIKMFVRNKQALFFTFFMPFIIMGIFGLVGVGGEQKVDIGIVSSSPNAPTTGVIERLKSIETLDITSGSEADEQQAIEAGDRALVIIIPNDLIPAENATARTQPAQVRILTNSGQQQQAQIGVAIINQVFNQSLLEFANAPRLFTLAVQDINARNLRYIDFLVPGVIAIAIMQLGVFSVAFFFTDLKQKGILKRLLATPLKPQHFVTANVITRLLVAIGQTVVLVGVGVLAFNYHVYGAYWLVLLITALGSIMFLGLGFTISGIATTVEAVPAIANLVVFPMLFLGGTFFPVDTMPDWLQHIVRYLPITFFAEAIRAVMNEGASFGDVSSDIVWMIVWSAILIFLATLTFSFEEKKV